MEYFLTIAVCLTCSAVMCAGVALWMRQKLRALEEFTDRRIDRAMEYAEGTTDRAEKRMMERRKQDLEQVEKLVKAVADLENGIVPDFEEAKAAAKAVNDFNAGISAIMGYDPMEALKKNRGERKGEDA